MTDKTATCFLLHRGIGYFRLASDASNSLTVLKAAGAVGFVTTVAGYYLLLHLILAAVECESMNHSIMFATWHRPNKTSSFSLRNPVVPVNVPLGDFSRFYKKRE